MTGTGNDPYGDSYEEIEGVLDGDGNPTKHRRATRGGDGVGSHSSEQSAISDEASSRNHGLAAE
jgi:hypothetical protein